eukprot:scaffold73357_cov85-Cyclotella_meneghiniana.AAC.1
MISNAILRATKLPTSGPYPTLDPFLFCVYHKDHYPPDESGDGKMQTKFPGNGMDFNPDAPYRMYHGEYIPGFPQHPHRGFETITATMEGLIDHADSVGNAGRYGEGDVQWMTAGEGVAHGEMFPLVHSHKANTLRDYFLNDDETSASEQRHNNAPPPDSWAVNPENDVAILHIIIRPGGN